jgi:hypothetical protein
VGSDKFEYSDDGVAMCAVGRVMLVVWRRIPSPARFRMFEQVTERMMQEFPDGFCQLQVIEPSSTPPAAPERQASSRLMERMATTARGIAFVIEGDDARTWIVRTILRGMSVLSRGGVPKTFVSKLPEGIAWIAPRLELSGSHRDELGRAILHLRESMQTASPPENRRHASL